MSRQQLSARIVIPAISVVTLLLGGCATTVSGHPRAASGDNLIPATTAVKPTGKPGPGAPSTTPRADRGGHTDFQASIGDCVKLGGTTTDATIDSAVCGSPDANYQVTGKAPMNAQCGKGADQVYYETLNGIETGALCLTIDWRVGDCMEVGTDVAHRIPCTTRDATDGVKVVSILQNTTSVDSCPGDNQGYVYEERKVVVCVDTL
ncbi:LppU family putative lipoprotein [Nocardia sp. NPDC004722]